MNHTTERRVLHDVKGQRAAPRDATQASRTPRTWRSVAELPFEAQEALFAVRGGRGGGGGDDDKSGLIDRGGATHYAARHGAGQATVVTAAPAVAEMNDQESPVKQFRRLLLEFETTDPVILWTRAVQADVNVGGQVTHIANPDAPFVADGEHHALVIGNQHYRYLSELPGAGEDAGILAGVYQGLGYSLQHHQDLDTATARTVLAFSKGLVKPGDRLFISVHGHGSEMGFCGIDHNPRHENDRLGREVGDDTNVVAWSVFSSLAQAAVAEGWDCTIVLEACHGGRAQHAIERNGDYTETRSERQITRAEDEHGDMGRGRLRSQVDFDKLTARRNGRSDTADDAVKYLVELIDGGNEAQIYLAAEAVATAAKGTPADRVVPHLAINQLPKAQAALRRVISHPHLQDPDVAALLAGALRDMDATILQLKELLGR